MFCYHVNNLTKSFLKHIYIFLIRCLATKDIVFQLQVILEDAEEANVTNFLESEKNKILIVHTKM